MSTETPGQSVGERMKEAFGGIDMKSAMRLTFGKCPECGTRLVRGSWLRWCPDRACQKHIGVLNKALGNKVEYIKPKTPAEEGFLASRAIQMEVSTS